MGLFLCNKWQWTCSVVVLTFSLFLGIPTNNRVSGATLRNYAVLTLRSDDPEQVEGAKAFGFNGSANKRPGPAATHSQTPVNHQHTLNQQQLHQNHQQYQIQAQQSSQQVPQPPSAEIQVTGGTLQPGYDHYDQSSLLELGASFLPSLGGAPLQTSTFFASNTPQRPPASQVAPTSVHQLQYPGQQATAALQQQNIPSPPLLSSPDQQQQFPPQIGLASAQHLESSAQLQQSTSQQQQFQETQVQSQQSSLSTQQAQQPHLEQPSPSPAPPQELSPVPQAAPQQQESHVAPPQAPPAQEEPQHLSSQQPQPPPQVQQVSHSHQSSSSPSQQPSQQVVSQQQHYSKPPAQEPIILEQYQSVVHTEPQSTPEHPQAPYHPQGVPTQLAEAPQVPPQHSDEVQVPPQQHADVAAAAPVIAEPSIDHEHLESVEIIPSQQSSSSPSASADIPPVTVQEVELPQEQQAAPSGPSTFLLLPQNSINSPLQSSNFGVFNKPPIQEDTQLSGTNQPQDQSFLIIGSILANHQQSPGSGQHKPQEQATSSDSNEDLPLANEESASPPLLESTAGWGPNPESVSGQTLVMDTSLVISSAAAVSSVHTEELNLSGDHLNPAIAVVEYGSDAHHGVSGNTVQVSSGSTQGFQNSEGHIDGGSSQLYELATMGEHNEVLVSGSSGSEAVGSVSQQSLTDTIMAEAPVQQLSQQEAEVEIPVYGPQIESQPQVIELAPQSVEDTPLEIPQIEPQPIEEVPLQTPEIEPQVIELAPEHVEVPQTEPQLVEAPIVSQATVSDQIPVEQSSQTNPIVAPANNLIQASQQELLQFLLSQQQENELETLQTPSDTNSINEAVSMSHSGQNQAQQSSGNQVSNNLVVSQQLEISKVPEKKNKLSEKISEALIKPAKGLIQMRFISDEGKITPEQEGLFAAMLQ